MRRCLPVSLLALTLFGSACGSDDDSSSGPPDAANDTTGVGGTAGAGGGAGGGGADGGSGAAGSGGAGGTAATGGGSGSAGTAGSAGAAGQDGGAVVPPCDAASNLLANPSFELSTAGTPDAWLSQPGGAGATIAATVETFAVDGSTVMRLTTPNVQPASRLSYQASFASEAVSVASGSVLSGHFHAKLTDWGLNGYEPVVQIQLLDANDQVVQTSQPRKVPYQAGPMLKLEIPPTTVAAGAVSAQVQLVLKFDTTVYFDAMCLRSDPG